MASSRRCGLVDGRSRVIALFLPRIQYVVLSVEGWPSAPAVVILSGLQLSRARGMTHSDRNDRDLFQLRTYGLWVRRRL